MDRDLDQKLEFLHLLVRLPAVAAQAALTKATSSKRTMNLSHINGRLTIQRSVSRQLISPKLF